ncbi:MAG: IS256 family transposase, partial [Polaromonas sp.]
FRRNAPLEKSVWEKLMLGLSTRNYGPAVKEFADAYGVQKSVVSERFIQASREKLKALIERPLGDLRLAAILVDGKPVKGHHMIVALGLGLDGRKTVLGFRQGATENATVVSELLGDLAGRGLDFTQPCLWVLDGSKALQAAVRRHAGEAALIQRCQLHKKRNVLDHLPQEHQPAVERKLNEAYGLAEYGDARKALDRLHRELVDINPSAARSLAEGLEETLTVNRLRVPALLRKTLSSSNVIESAFSVVETACRNVKRWRDGDHVQRWVASGLLVAERKFRRIKGYREIPHLVAALTALFSEKGVAKRAGAA